MIRYDRWYFVNPLFPLVSNNSSGKQCFFIPEHSFQVITKLLVVILGLLCISQYKEMKWEKLYKDELKYQGNCFIHESELRRDLK